MTMSNRQYRDSSAAFFIDNAIGKPVKKVASRPVKVHRPSPRAFADQRDGLIQFSQECVCHVLAMLGIPQMSCSDFGNRFGMKFRKGGTHPAVP